MPVAAASLCFGLFLALFSPLEAAERFKLQVQDQGVYGVEFEQLQQAGLPPQAVPVSELSLTNLGEQVPIWFESHDEGFFGPGDRLIFVGGPLLGSYSFYDEYSNHNVYVLEVGSEEGILGVDAVAPPVIGSPKPRPLTVRHHLEEDVLMVRFRERPEDPQERWYWSRMSVTDRQPFRVDLELNHLKPYRGVARLGAAQLKHAVLDPAGADEIADLVRRVFSTGELETEVTLSVELRGWSVPRRGRELPDHVVEIQAGDRALPPAEWDGKEPFVHTVTIPSGVISDEQLRLEFRVPKRMIPETEDLFVDVSLMNWIEVEYPRDEQLGSGESRIRISREDPDTSGLVSLFAASEGWLYGASGTRVALGEGLNQVLIAADAEGDLFAVTGSDYRPVDRVVHDVPSMLRVTDRQADYLIVTHATLRAAVEPLAEFHRGRGLQVAVIDIEDVYDEFNHGIENPRALRDFFSWAYHHWQTPRPRFVLLAGDASWDPKNATADDSRYADWTYRPGEVWNFVKNASTAYDDEIDNRDLVPTWSYRTHQGHAASDNGLVTIDGDDSLPDLAVGRIPVVTPEDMEAVVSKTIRYVRDLEAGDWQRRLLFITNESAGFQRSSDRAAEVFAERGYKIEKIYPSSEEKANDRHSARILEAFDEGLLLVQFLGHGGRYIWRTGPPDLKKNHDLFTLEHLDHLGPNTKLPFVVSLTCYSAPFDHPTADSIGEKLLRLPDRGAIGVFAASWRNSPSSTMGRELFEELTTPGATIGEAIQNAKHHFNNENLIQTYNLLGDPAIPLAVAVTESEVTKASPSSQLDSRANAGENSTKPSSSRPSEP